MDPSKINLKTKKEEEIGEVRVLRLLGTTITVTESNTGHVFTCLTCNGGFPSFQALGDHQASHNSNHPASAPAVVASGSMPAKLHGCRYCSAKFSTGQALGGHMTNHQKDTMEEKQKDEGSSSKRKRENEISKVRVLRLLGTTITVPVSNTGRNFTCWTCKKGFPSFQALGGHRASHGCNHPNSVAVDEASGSSPAKLYTCRYCLAKFSTGQALGGHMTKHRKDTTEEKQKDEGSSSKRKREDDIGEERFFLLFGAKIPISAETNNNRENMYNKEITSFQASGGNRASHSPNNPADLASGSMLVKSHACRYCSSKFSTGQALCGHMTKHRSERTKEEKKVDLLEEGSNMKSDLTCEEKSVGNISKSDC